MMWTQSKPELRAGGWGGNFGCALRTRTAGARSRALNSRPVYVLEFGALMARRDAVIGGSRESESSPSEWGRALKQNEST